MAPSEWIALAALLLIYGSAIGTFWIKIKIKLSEMDLRIEQVGKDLQEHEDWGVKQQSINENNMEKINNKLDAILENLNNFKIYVEKKI